MYWIPCKISPRSPWRRHWKFVGVMVGYFIVASIGICALTEQFKYGMEPIWLIIYVIIAFVGAGYFFWAYYSYVNSDRRKKKELSSILFLIILGLSIAILITVNAEYVPTNYSSFNKDNENMSVKISLPSPLLIPVKNLKQGITDEIAVKIFNYDKEIKIQSVNLLSPENSTITLEKRQFDEVLPKKSSTESEFKSDISVQHSGDIFNNRENYTIDITYLDSRNLTHSEISNCDTQLPINSVFAIGHKPTGFWETLAADKNNQSRWSNPAPAWISFDLGNQKNICSIKILWYLGNERQYDFEISVSNNSNTFEKVFTGTSKRTNSIEEYDVTDANARYIRIASNGTTSPAKLWVSINETSIIGSSFVPNLNSKISTESVEKINQGKIYHNLVTFPWTIKNLDMNLITYFWIVMTGVVASRFLDFILSRLKKEEDIARKIDDEMTDYINTSGLNKEIDNNIQDYRKKISYFRDNILQDLHWRELLWIVFSFIIAVLVFASFRQNVTPINSVLINISIAFAFGFTFDRTLEMATRFKPIFTSDSSSNTSNSKPNVHDTSNSKPNVPDTS